MNHESLSIIEAERVWKRIVETRGHYCFEATDGRTYHPRDIVTFKDGIPDGLWYVMDATADRDIPAGFTLDLFQEGQALGPLSYPRLARNVNPDDLDS